jgi:hypothetical protein
MSGGKPDIATLRNGCFQIAVRDSVRKRFVLELKVRATPTKPVVRSRT